MSYLEEFTRDIEAETATPWDEYTLEEQTDILQTGVTDLLVEIEKTEKAILAAARDPNDMTAQARFMANRKQLETERDQFLELYRVMRANMEKLK